MPTHQNWFPGKQADQIKWLKNWRQKVGGYQTPGAYSSSEIGATVADSDFCIILLETWIEGIDNFSQAATAYLNLILYGPPTTSIAAVPLFTGNPPSTVPPAPGSWPTVMPPGAALRIFAFVANMKTRAFYTPVVGQDLDVIGPESVFDPAAVPPVKAKALSGSVQFDFKKRAATESKSHQGVWLESQLEGEADFSFLAIDTGSPYHDTRPLKVPGKSEKRRYRVCFWDGGPTRVWTDVIEVVFAG